MERALTFVHDLFWTLIKLMPRPRTGDETQRGLLLCREGRRAPQHVGHHHAYQAGVRCYPEDTVMTQSTVQ